MKHLAPMRIWLLICALIAGLLSASLSWASDQFPVYDQIRPNVTFWTKVYTEYSTRQAIVHDSKHLDVVYTVIDLRPYEESSARKINRKRMKKASKKYEKILRRLAADPATDDIESRRVAELFGPDATARTFRAASRRIRCQIGQSDRFKLGLIRSGAYIDQIRAIFSSYGLPEELGYLPHVESSFNIKAYSKFGAAGIWQFTRSTGQLFMKVGYVLDERRDPFLATHAAASLLKDNYERLGSWPLAITAYNHGAAGMERAKAGYGDYPTIFESYRSRTFKFASRNFYSEFIAAYQIASNYQRYFGDIELDRPAQFQTVSLDGYASFEELCDHFKVSPGRARSLNPALRPPVFDGQKLVPKDYPFRLPADMALAAVPSHLLKRNQKPSRFYTVQRGDTAGRIARLHHVRLSDLILANNLNRRAIIYPKQTLRIPLPGEAVVVAQAKPSQEPVVSAVLASNDAQTKAPASPIAKDAEPPAEPEQVLPIEVPASTAGNDDVAIEPSGTTGSDEEPPTDAETGTPDESLVSAVPAANGDEASGPASPNEQEPPETETLAQHTEVVTAPTAMTDENTDESAGPELLADNAVPDAEIEASELENEYYPQPVMASLIPTRIPEISASEATAAQSEQPPSIEIVTADVGFESVISQGRRPYGVLQVEIEETLGHFAEWADVRTQQIRRLNGLSFGQTLHLHQKIKIPLTKKSAMQFEESRYEYHKRLQEDFFAVYRISEIQHYRVKRGDNLWTLCLEKFDIPMWLLKNCNPEVDFAELRLHQKIMVPIIEKNTADDPGLETDPEPEPEETKASTGPRKETPL